MKRPQGFLVAVATALFSLYSSVVHAGIISWTYQATVSTTYDAVTSPDLLSINGETINLSLIFDDAKVWEEASGWLYFSPDSVIAAISGGHTLSPNTNAVAAAYGDSCCAAIVEQVGSRSYVDLFIDGNLTLMSGNGLAIPNGPSLGDNLQVAHLPRSLDTFTFFEYTNPAELTARYNLVNESISVTVSPVPEPETYTLVLMGLAILYCWKRCRKHPTSR